MHKSIVLALPSAVKDRKTGRYILNQRNKQVDGDVQTSFIEAGTKWTYISKDGRETLTSNGPIKAEVSIMVWHQQLYTECLLTQ